MCSVAFCYQTLTDLEKCAIIMYIMKIFLHASPYGEQDYGEYYKKIHSEFTRLGYKHTSNDIVEYGTDAYEEDMQKGENAEADVFHSKMKALKQADICVFEASFESVDTGFLINKSVEQGKPTIVFYLKGRDPCFVSGAEDEKLIVKEYTEKNIKKTVKDAIDVARERRDKRFNFFISPKLLEYLERASSAEGVTKSKFIRNLITDHMRETKGDDEYYRE